MSVSNYTPYSETCGYNYSKLKNVVYLVSKSHLKDVHIDNGYAYIDGLTELPMQLSGFNITLSEESSLDERYKFSKTVTFSMTGYVPSSSFDDKYYVILESMDGTLWMVNIDFPSKVSYKFNLSANQNQTDFTFKSESNFPTLMLAESFGNSLCECKGYNASGIESLYLLESQYARFDENTKTLYTYGKDYQEIEFIKNTCSFTEEFDGEMVTSTVGFNIGFDAYKSSWHYNLLEFLENLYTAVIVPKNGDNRFFSGFNFGLQPSFTISSTSDNGQGDIITVTLVEASNHGSSAAVDWDEKHSTDKKWVYIATEGAYKCYECIGNGLAKYLVMKEFNENGYPTGNYKVLQGYEAQFQGIGNIVGTFSNIETFFSPDCSVEQCSITSDIPSSINFSAATCYTYSMRSTCDWNITNIPSFATVSPSTGAANTSYTISVCNTATTFDGRVGTFTIMSGTNSKYVTLTLNGSSSVLTPTAATVNCLSQNVTFSYNSSCPITVTSIDSSLQYQLTSGSLVVTVPRNHSTASTRSYNISVKDCNNRTQTVTITQDKTYENWVNTSGFICVSGDSYTRLIRYTGTTSTNINTVTDEYMAGTLITTSDSRCSSTTSKWQFDNHYYCVNGNKYKALEEYVSNDGGSNWTRTGVTKLGDLAEANSEWCNLPVTYEWRLSTKWECDEIGIITRWVQTDETTCVQI